jgi:hypothetical protein
MSNKLTCKVPEPHNPPPPLTHCIPVNSILIHTGKEEGELEEGYRGNSSQSWVENANMTYCITRL